MSSSWVLCVDAGKAKRRVHIFCSYKLKEEIEEEVSKSERAERLAFGVASEGIRLLYMRMRLILP